MPHAIWSGAINFGLVTIPVKLFTAVRTNDLRFNFLHKNDEGRINNVRRCSLDGKDVAYGDLVRGYEYEKGKYVILTTTISRGRGRGDAVGRHRAVRRPRRDQPDVLRYALLLRAREERPARLRALARGPAGANKVAIARVVLRSREHLAAVKPNGEALVLELMHYADEIVEQSDFDFPELRENLPESEMKVAKMLIDSMAGKFEPEQFNDEYREKLMGMIEARAAGKELPRGKAKAPVATNVVNLMDVLQRSLEQSKGGGRAAASGRRRPRRRGSARIGIAQAQHEIGRGQTRGQEDPQAERRLNGFRPGA